jgi:hypothetical protein
VKISDAVELAHASSTMKVFVGVDRFGMEKQCACLQPWT